MADLIYPPDYAAQIAQAANIAPDAATRWATAGLTNQQAQGLAIQNQLARSRLPWQQQIIQQGMANGQAQGGSIMPQGQPQSPNVPLTFMGGQGGAQQPPSQTPQGPTSGNPNPDAQPQPTSTQGAPQTATGPGTSNQGETPSQRVNDVEGNFNSALANAFQPVPTSMDPQTSAQYYALMQQAANADASAMAGMPGAHEAAEGYRTQAQALKTQFEASAQNTNQQRRNSANLYYSYAQDVHDAAGKGAAGVMLKTMVPDLYESLPQNLTNDQYDQIAQKFGDSLFNWTGRKPELHDDGYFYDSTTGNRILGNSTRVGMTPQQIAELRVKANTPDVPVTVDNNTFNTTPWDAANITARQRGQPIPYLNADDYIKKTQVLSQQSDQAAQQQNTPNVSPPAQVPSPPSGTTASSTIPPQGNTPSQNVGESSRPAGTLEAPLNYNIGAQKAPGLPSLGTQANPTAYNEYTQEAQKYRDQYSDQAAQAHSALALDKDMLQNQLPNAATGPGSMRAADLQTFFANLFMDKNGNWDPAKLNGIANDPAASQILNKRLNFDALGGVENLAKNAGGVRGSALMAQIAMKQLSANADLAKPAIQYMLKWDIANNTYDTQKYGTDLDGYDRAGNRLDTYDKWYNTYGRPADKVIPNLMKRMDDQGNIRPLPDIASKAQAWAGWPAKDKRGWYLLGPDKNGLHAYVNPNDPSQFDTL